MLFFLDVGRGFLLQQRGELFLLIRSIAETVKTPNTLRSVGVYPPLNRASAAGNGGR